MSSSLSASIFRRGGQKKEASKTPEQLANDAVDEDAIEEEEKLLSCQELLAVISAPRSGKEFSAAIWRPQACAAELVKSRKATAKSNGFMWHRKQYLHIEEAVFLMDRGDLMLFSEVHQGQQRLLSVQEGYELMVSLGVTMERFLVYAHLMRSGYLVMRHPSRWLLDPEESPCDCWGQWLSSECVALPLRPSTSSSPGEAEATMQQEEIQPRFHAPARSAESSPCLAAEAENKPEVGSAMRCDEDQGGSAAAEELQRVKEAAAAAQNHHRQWWETLGPSHPAFGGMVPDEWFDQDVPRHAVQESPGQRLKLQHPRLKPLGPIPDGPHLGPSTSSCRVVFDVFKPGSKVARAKQLFPDVMWHVSICSSKPPTPQEIRLAQGQIQAAGSRATLVWASVDNAIISFFQVIGINLMKLM